MKKILAQLFLVGLLFQNACSAQVLDKSAVKIEIEEDLATLETVALEWLYFRDNEKESADWSLETKKNLVSSVVQLSIHQKGADSGLMIKSAGTSIISYTSNKTLVDGFVVVAAESNSGQNLYVVTKDYEGDGRPFQIKAYLVGRRDQ